MIRQRLYISDYKWTVYVFYAVDQYFSEEILALLEHINCPSSIMDRIRQNFEKDDMDTGFTYSNPSKRKTVMVIGKASSSAEFFNSVTHEIRHCVDDISKEIGMPMAGEDVAYLTGHISQLMFYYIKLFICDCNHCKKQLKYEKDINGHDKWKKQRRSF